MYNINVYNLLSFLTTKCNDQVRKWKDSKFSHQRAGVLPIIRVERRLMITYLETEEIVHSVVIIESDQQIKYWNVYSIILIKTTVVSIHVV